MQTSGEKGEEREGGREVWGSPTGRAEGGGWALEVPDLPLPSHPPPPPPPPPLRPPAPIPPATPLGLGPGTPTLAGKTWGPAGAARGAGGLPSWCCARLFRLRPCRRGGRGGPRRAGAGRALMAGGRGRPFVQAAGAGVPGRGETETAVAARGLLKEGLGEGGAAARVSVRPCGFAIGAGPEGPRRRRGGPRSFGGGEGSLPSAPGPAGGPGATARGLLEDPGRQGPPPSDAG